MTDERERDEFLRSPWLFMSGHYEARLIVWREGEEPEDIGFEVVQEQFPDGNFGKTLSKMRQKLGGDEGHLTAPDGAQVPVSLLPWVEWDPQTTRVMQGFRFVSDDEDAYQGLLRRFLGDPPALRG